MVYLGSLAPGSLDFENQTVISMFRDYQLRGIRDLGKLGNFDVHVWIVEAKFGRKFTVS